MFWGEWGDGKDFDSHTGQQRLQNRSRYVTKYKTGLDQK